MECRELQILQRPTTPVLLFDHPFALLSGVILFLNPFEGLSQAMVQCCAGLPFQFLLDKRIVAVATGHSTRRVQVVIPFKLDPRDFLDLRDQVIDGNQFAGAQVDGGSNQVITMHDLVDAIGAIINKHEAARLMPIAPDADRMIP